MADRGGHRRRGGWRPATVLLSLCFAAVIVPAAQVSAASLVLASGDGVRLTLGTDGRVAGLGLGTRNLPMVGNGGFAVRKVGGMPNLVPNGDFELDADLDGVPDGWNSLYTPAAKVSTTVAHSGSRSVELHRKNTGDSGLLSIDVPVRPSTEYTISAWMKSQGVQPTAPPALTYTALSPVRVLVQQFHGKSLLTNGYLYGYTDTADWNRQSLGIRTDPRATSVRLTVRLMDGSGTAWFDDLAMSELFQPAVVPIRGSAARGAGGIVKQHADLPGQGLSFDATYRAAADRITVDGTVRNTSSGDLPVQLSYTLPFDAVGWTWSDYARETKPIQAGQVYDYDTRWQVQTMSRYPWSTLGDAQSSLSIGIPLAKPRIARTHDGPDGLTISFDLGLSPFAARLGNAATFEFVIFTSDPAWGFRAATAKYYAMYPQDFVRRTDPAREGAWGQRKYLGPWAGVMTDFGMGLDVLGLGNDSGGGDNNDAALLPADNAAGIYASAYNHHWGYKFKLPHRDPVPTYERAIQLLEETAAGPTGTEQQRKVALKARAAIASAARDYNGRLVYERYVDKYLQYYLDLDPLPGAIFDAARVGHDFQILGAIADALAVHARLDAIHFDSTSGMRRWGAQDDYSHRHWAVATVPLTFSYDSGLVAERISFSDFGQIQREADYLHGKGMILSSNFNGSEARAGAWFGADKIDYFGLEQGLPEKTGDGDIYVTQDGYAMFKRTLAYQRPVTTLDPLVGRGLLTTAEVERRLQLNLFYGIYAGIGGSDDKLTEPIHQLYLRYTPIFRAIDLVGWQPVTLATPSDARLWLERYGSLASGPLYLTVRNETTKARPYVVTVDLRGAGAPAGQLTGHELIADADVTVTTSPTQDHATFGGTIAAGSTQVIRITRAP